VIEQEAARAAALAPDLDCAGPDRMLGELYRQAPGRPWSIGDPAKAVVHFRRAAALAPDSVANRLGLAQALLAAGTGPGPIQEACALLRSIGEERADSPEAAARAEAGELLARRCGK
jgi:predicted Zn-dependent protease